jgi:hypothetical protein
MPRDIQKEYEEELEYHYQNQTVNIPDKKKPGTYEKIKAGVKSGAQKAYAAGAGVARTIHEVGQNPHVQQVRSQQGFIQRNAQQGIPRHSTSRQQYSGAPVVGSSVMHPGNRIVVMRCSDETGKCKVIATGRSEERPRQPRRRRPGYATGMLGGEDYGL